MTRRVIMKIHKKYYDLTGFNHPGGPIAMLAGNRRDATALFESHHPFTEKSKMDAILAKYEMPDSPDNESLLLPMEKENGELFDWEETLNSNFTIELREQVKAYFKELAISNNLTIGEAIKATPQRWFEWIIVMNAAAYSCMVMLYSESVFWSWLNVALFPFFYWIGGFMYHDGSHFSVSNNWRVNWYIQYVHRIIASPFDWLYEHIIGHHQYVNIHNRDPDLNHETTLNFNNDITPVRYSKDVKWDKIHIKQERFYYFMSSFSFILLGTLNGLRMMITNVYNNCVYYNNTFTNRLYHLCDLLLGAYIVFILPFTIWTPFYAIKHILLPWYITSCIFILNTTMNHFNPETMTYNKNWYIHQVITSHNFGLHNILYFYTSIGLNYQIEHHLFPSVNHCHLPNIQPIVKRLCDKYNISYNHSSGYKEAIYGAYNHLRLMGLPPSSSEHQANNDPHNNVHNNVHNVHNNDRDNVHNDHHNDKKTL
jgi:fatty acid desaturase